MMRALFYFLASVVLFFYITSPITSGRHAAQFYKGFVYEMNKQGPIKPEVP